MTKQQLYYKLSIIRDDHPEVRDFIDEIREDDFFEECHGMD